MPIWEQLAMQTAGQGVGAGMGLLLQGQQDKRQLKQQGKLQNLQIAGQKEMTDYNQMKQLQMWKDTNYGPQMAQLKAAGLNPGLIYGMSGGGGATTGQASGNVTAAHAPTGGGEVQAMAGMGLQSAMNLKLMQAQKENIEADTANKQADIPVKEATAPNIQQDTLNKKAQEALTKVQEEITKLDKEYLGRSMENRLSEINYRVSNMIEQVKIIENDREISDATKQDTINKIKTEALGAAIANTLTEQKTTESKAAINKMAGDLINASRGLDIAARQQKIHEWAETVKANFPSIGQALGRGLNDLIESIIGTGGGTRPVQYTPPKKQ